MAMRHLLAGTVLGLSLLLLHSARAGTYDGYALCRSAPDHGWAVLHGQLVTPGVPGAEFTCSAFPPEAVAMCASGDAPLGSPPLTQDDCKAALKQMGK